LKNIRKKAVSSAEYVRISESEETLKKTILELLKTKKIIGFKLFDRGGTNANIGRAYGVTSCSAC
jgi:hypothetical protein